jgi:transcriptional regulator with XRE-family HTH domain
MNFDLRKDLGRQLAEKRNAKGYTQRQVAELLGITRPQLSGYENGRVIYPTLEVLLKAAEVLETEFVVGGYRLGRQRAKVPAPRREAPEKQLVFGFYKGRAPGDANIRITTVRRRVVIRASVVAARS